MLIYEPLWIVVYHPPSPLLMLRCLAGAPLLMLRCLAGAPLLVLRCLAGAPLSMLRCLAVAPLCILFYFQLFSAEALAHYCRCLPHFSCIFSLHPLLQSAPFILLTPAHPAPALARPTTSPYSPRNISYHGWEGLLVNTIPCLTYLPTQLVSPSFALSLAVTPLIMASIVILSLDGAHS